MSYQKYALQNCRARGVLCPGSGWYKPYMFDERLYFPAPQTSSLWRVDETKSTPFRQKCNAVVRLVLACQNCVCKAVHVTLTADQVGWCVVSRIFCVCVCLCLRAPLLCNGVWVQSLVRLDYQLESDVVR